MAGAGCAPVGDRLLLPPTGLRRGCAIRGRDFIQASLKRGLYAVRDGFSWAGKAPGHVLRDPRRHHRRRRDLRRQPGQGREGTTGDRGRLPVGRAEFVCRTCSQARRRRAASADRADASAGAGADLQRAAVRSVRELHQQPGDARRQAAPQREDARERRTSSDGRRELCQRRQQADRRCRHPGGEGRDRRDARRSGVRGELQERPAGRRSAGAAYAGQPEGDVHDVAVLHLPGRQVRAQRERADLRRVLEGRAAREGHLLRYDRRSRRRHRVRQGGHGPHHGDRERPQPDERDGHPAAGRNSGPVDGEPAEAGADDPVGPVALGGEVHRHVAARRPSTRLSPRSSWRSRSS